MKKAIAKALKWLMIVCSIPLYPLFWLVEAVEEWADECPCGKDTCVEPWEPGCGLGTSEDHAKVAED